jgi:hypothetical protein
MRGGPYNRKKMVLQDHVSILEVAGMNTNHSVYLDQNVVLPTYKRGRYTKTMHPFADGSYAYVWLGWGP